MAWAIDQQEIKLPSARHVLMCLANYADVSGRSAFPSIGRLMLDTGMDRRTIQRNLRRLEEAHLIIKADDSIVAAYIDRPDRRPCCYKLAISQRGGTAPRREVTGRQPGANGAANTTQRGGTAPPNPSEIRHLTEEKDAFKKAREQAERVGFRSPEASETPEAYRMAVLRYTLKH